MEVEAPEDSLGADVAKDAVEVDFVDVPGIGFVTETIAFSTVELVFDED